MNENKTRCQKKTERNAYYKCNALIDVASCQTLLHDAAEIANEYAEKMYARKNYAMASQTAKVAGYIMMAYYMAPIRNFSISEQVTIYKYLRLAKEIVEKKNLAAILLH